MRISVREVPLEGKLVLKEVADPFTLDLDTRELKFCQPVNITAQISRTISLIEVYCQISTKAKAVCSRCLKEYALILNKSYHWHYPIESSDMLIDISDDLRQEFILDYPLVFLCKPNCKGICAGCGADLNEEECRCK